MDQAIVSALTLAFYTLLFGEPAERLEAEPRAQVEAAELRAKEALQALERAGATVSIGGTTEASKGIQGSTGKHTQQQKRKPKSEEAETKKSP